MLESNSAAQHDDGRDDVSHRLAKNSKSRARVPRSPSQSYEITCTFAFFGCPWVGRRCDLPRHLSDFCACVEGQGGGARDDLFSWQEARDSVIAAEEEERRRRIREHAMRPQRASITSPMDVGHSDEGSKTSVKRSSFAPSSSSSANVRVMFIEQPRLLRRLIVEGSEELQARLDHDLVAHFAASTHASARLNGARQRCLGDLQRITRALWGLHVGVYAYGSTVTGTASISSDFDVVIVGLRHRGKSGGIFVTADEGDMTDASGREALERLQASIIGTTDESSIGEGGSDAGRGGVFGLRVEKLVQSSKVSVLKMTAHTRVQEEAAHGTEARVAHGSSVSSCLAVDLSVDCARHSGLMSRAFMSTVLDHLPTMAPVVVSLKTWMTRLGLNNAYQGGLSSYGIFLLVFLAALRRLSRDDGPEDGNKEDRSRSVGDDVRNIRKIAVAGMVGDGDDNDRHHDDHAFTSDSTRNNVIDYHQHPLHILRSAEKVGKERALAILSDAGVYVLSSSPTAPLPQPSVLKPSQLLLDVLCIFEDHHEQRAQSAEPHSPPITTALHILRPSEQRLFFGGSSRTTAPISGSDTRESSSRVDTVLPSSSTPSSTLSLAHMMDALVLEDPLNANNNVARSCFKFAAIEKAFSDAVDRYRALAVRPTGTLLQKSNEEPLGVEARGVAEDVTNTLWQVLTSCN